MVTEKTANTNQKHWTARSADSLAHAIAFDFIAQLEQYFERNETSQVDVARALGVSKSAVCKVLNNPQNLTLKTIAKYSHALGLKPAIVAYRDNDENEDTGLVPGGIFRQCWNTLGRPRDVWAMEEASVKAAGTATVFNVYVQQRPMGMLINRTSDANSTQYWLKSPWGNSEKTTSAFLP